MKLGLHIATAGNLMTAPERAHQMGAEVIQIFAGNPRGWRPTSYTPEQGQQFQAACAAAQISEVFLHEIYLVSYGHPEAEMRRKSVAALGHSLAIAELLGARGVVTHMGSHKGAGLEQALERIKDSFTEALKGSESSWLIIENSAGAGGNIANSLEEIAQIIDVMDGHPRIKVCIDTAHTLTSGYDIRTLAGWDDFMNKFDRLIGLDRLACLHLNDSKAELDSHVDRHQNIGDGCIGNEGFRAIVNDRRLATTPGILEVPGLEDNGPDAANLERLRKLVQK